MIKNIIFDMGGVLIDWTPEKYTARYDISAEDKTLLEDVIYKDYRWPLLDFGYYETEQAFLEDAYKLLPERLHQIAKELVCDWDKPEILNYPGMGELVKQLKENGYNIYLLSNAGARHKEYWHKVAGSEYFDGVVISNYEKQFKPCPEIYKTLLNRYNLVADECVFTDDMATNCAGAFLCGIHPIVFRGPERLKVELRKLGVKI